MQLGTLFEYTPAVQRRIAATVKAPGHQVQLTSIDDTHTRMTHANK